MALEPTGHKSQWDPKNKRWICPGLPPNSAIRGYLCCPSGGYKFNRLQFLSVSHRGISGGGCPPTDSIDEIICGPKPVKGSSYFCCRNTQKWVPDSPDRTTVCPITTGPRGITETGRLIAQAVSQYNNQSSNKKGKTAAIVVAAVSLSLLGYGLYLISK